MGHLGLTPQSVNQLGGSRAGPDDAAAEIPASKPVNSRTPDVLDVSERRIPTHPNLSRATGPRVPDMLGLNPGSSQNSCELTQHVSVIQAALNAYTTR
jgi:hypothetical protein